MLTKLCIRNFTIIESVELHFLSGMTSFTGETGAGKSILVDALSLLLGGYNDGISLVRPGAEYADISATFDLTYLPEAKQWLIEQSIITLQQSYCCLKLNITNNGCSTHTINGFVKSKQVLRLFGKMLIHIHSQGTSQALTNRSRQLQLLDEYAENQSILNDLTKIFKKLSKLQRQIYSTKKVNIEKEMTETLLYYLKELNALNFTTTEFNELETKQKFLSNKHQILDSINKLLIALTDCDGQSILERLDQIINKLTHLSKLDPHLVQVNDLLQTAVLQLIEASNELRNYLNQLAIQDYSNELEQIEYRLSTIYQVSRKHGIAVTALPNLKQDLTVKLQSLESQEIQLGNLRKEIEQTLCHYKKIAHILSERRIVAAAELGQEISTALTNFGISGGCFKVHLKPRETPALHGYETVEFLVSINPGQPLYPLSKVASGGELSRISLAIMQTLARKKMSQRLTLIFDEIDTGIGGHLAEVVGICLRELGQAQQVLCITHLPQVAAQAHYQFKVAKEHTNSTTYVEIKILQKEERIDEIARMLGGMMITTNSRAHAQEMLDATPK